jgi:ATP-dependent Lhr-like helicase
MTTALPSVPDLPPAFADWFQARGWTPHGHQLEMLAAAREGQSALLIAPTGGGKTLAGFLPSLVDLAASPREGLHTLYISPLKALAVDIQRNLTQPVAEIGLELVSETRTGDTPQSKRNRQRRTPPHILLTTPESLALLLSYHDAPQIFAGLACVVVDELHALAGNKRGDLLSLGLARLSGLAPGCRRVGLSATVPDKKEIVAWLSPTGRAEDAPIRLIEGRSGAKAVVQILSTQAYLPWSGHMAVHALAEVYQAIRRAGTTLVFVNTRAQAEIVFQELWRLNDEKLPIGLHHGSLPWPGARCALSWPLRPSTWGSTGRRSIWWSRWGRPRACPAWSSAWAGPTTAWTSRAGRSWCPPTASRCWSAAPRSKGCAPAPWTATRPKRAAWTCWPSTSWEQPAASHFTPTSSMTR